MKLGKILNEMIIIVISLLSIIILRIYSNEHGIIVSVDNTGKIDWYSTDYMSSGGDDFILFIGWNIIFNILLIIICILNLIINISGKNIKHFSYYIYIIIIIFQCFLLFLINLDINIINAMLLGDKYMIIWILIFGVGFIIVNINHILNRKSKYGT